jgi:hypothetical protein
MEAIIRLLRGLAFTGTELLLSRQCASPGNTLREGSSITIKLQSELLLLIETPAR